MARSGWFLVGALSLFGGAARAQAPSPGLAQQLSVMAQSLAAGQRPASEMFGTYGANRRGVSFYVVLNAGRCYTFVGAGGPGVVDVDMFLFDPSNRRVALDRRYDAYTQIVHCATFPGSYRVELKVKRGAGEVAFQTFEAASNPAPPPAAPAMAIPPPPMPVYVPPPPNAPAPPLAPVAPRPSDPLARELAALSAGMRPYGPLLGGFTTDGRGQDLFVTLEAGRCYTFLSVSSPTVRRLSTYLWEPMTNRRVATDRDPTNSSRLVHCATIPGAYHFQAKAEGGGGEFRTGVYAQ